MNENGTVPQFETVNPAALLADTNIRHDLHLTDDFRESIAEQGVLTPITVCRTAAGAMRVLTGHRRTAAALEAGLTQIPAMIVGDEQDGTEATIDRLVTQWSENEHRAAITTGERLALFEALADHGLDSAKIARRTKVRRTEVDAALTLRGTEQRDAVQRGELTIEQAAAIAEFSDDPAAVGRIEWAIRSRRLDHALAAERLCRTERTEALARAAAVLAEAGIDAVAMGSMHEWIDDANSATIERVTDVDGNTPTIEEVAAAGHLGLYVDSRSICYHRETGEEVDEDDLVDELPAEDQREEWMIPRNQVIETEETIRYWHVIRCGDSPWRTYWGNRAANPAAGEVDAEARAAQRREVIENNRAWRAATEVRRTWLAQQSTRKTAPKGTAAFVATALVKWPQIPSAYHARALTEQMIPAADALTKLATAPDARAMVLLRARILIALESQVNADHWRTPADFAQFYLRAVADQGYTLSDIERRAAGLEPLTDEQ
ncbi:ParB/RepB/Spo0J family partition protein [Rhodococcus artemisiae]|uniref:ParB/RepB/Spo0J family partition protein n=1 Tax=Rhodococcus artemisiae TaxID=714159 RepID=A0ABU7LJG7_9NOCA|nr:ParB/RepB/Spo0J family partition protein [Rhodococcus artemisiae]MEE2061695.1 ParB/RepB/Spo0J family partition protein [Rhodococcus artemisiae]